MHASPRDDVPSDGLNPATQAFQLVLLVTGSSPRSSRARANLQEALRTIDTEAIRLTMIDLLTQPRTALDYGVFASPALLWDHEGRASAVLYGDLSNQAALHLFLTTLPSTP